MHVLCMHVTYVQSHSMFLFVAFKTVCACALDCTVLYSGVAGINAKWGYYSNSVNPGDVVQVSNQSYGNLNEIHKYVSIAHNMHEFLRLRAYYADAWHLGAEDCRTALRCNHVSSFILHICSCIYKYNGRKFNPTRIMACP